jgi:hypothetical protein
MIEKNCALGNMKAEKPILFLAGSLLGTGPAVDSQGSSNNGLLVMVRRVAWGSIHRT